MLGPETGKLLKMISPEDTNPAFALPRLADPEVKLEIVIGTICASSLAAQLATRNTAAKYVGSGNGDTIREF